MTSYSICHSLSDLLCALGCFDGKESACNAGDRDLIPGVRKIPWRREWVPSPLFLPEKSHELESLAGYSPSGHKESDMTD